MTLDMDVLQKEQQRRALEEKQHADDVAPVRHLIQRYRKASGDAFAAGQDGKASEYRKAVGELEAVLIKLPALPAPTVRG